jgi:hypothetical protein
MASTASLAPESRILRSRILYDRYVTFYLYTRTLDADVYLDILCFL